MKAGCARAAITPPLGLRFAGKTHDEPIIITGICSDIYARAIVLSSGERKIALASVELCYLHAFWVDQIRWRVARQADIPAENIFIIATHNHSGPDTFWDFDPKYVGTVMEKIADCILEANSTLVEVRLGIAGTPISGPATNRRIKMKDGSVWMRAIGFEAPPPEQVIGPGPVDPQLRLLKLETVSGRPLALVANYACHASVALESTCVSGDFPGYAADSIERETNALFFFTAGASADITPIGFVHNRSDQEARRVGTQFARDVLALADEIVTRPDGSIDIRKATVIFPIRREFFRLDKGIPLRLPAGSAARFFPSSLECEVQKIKRMEENGILPPLLETGNISAEMSLFRVGDLKVVTIPGELFVEIGLDLLSRTSSLSWIISHCNHAVGYIPTAVAFEEGGYESAPFALSLLTAEAETIVKTTAADLIESMR